MQRNSPIIMKVRAAAIGAQNNCPVKSSSRLSQAATLQQLCSSSAVAGRRRRGRRVGGSGSAEFLQLIAAAPWPRVDCERRTGQEPQQQQQGFHSTASRLAYGSGL